MGQHQWKTDEADGLGSPVRRCTNGTCTVRKVENTQRGRAPEDCTTLWQRDKGGHWRDVKNEEIPPCTGEPVGRRKKRTPAESSSP